MDADALAVMVDTMQVDDGALDEEPAGSTCSRRQTIKKPLTVEASSEVDKENHQVRQRG